ncbi:MAG: ATP-binding protein [Collinsella sp.]
MRQRQPCVPASRGPGPPGIPKQYRESIFQPFFRLDKSRSRAYGGAGLGLALVWEIAALHGGTVEVEASSENGTTMLASLPKRSAALTEQ